MILVILYMVAGYWATGRTIYRNKILISTRFGGIFFARLFMGTLFGIILIPVAIIMWLLGK